MSAYQTPLVRALSLDAALLSCNAHQQNTSGNCSRSIFDCVTVGIQPIFIAIDPENLTIEAPGIDTTPILTNTILGVNGGGVRVTPLANTNIPGSDPILVGVPLGVHGVEVDITATRGYYAINPNGLGVDVLDSHFALAHIALP